MTAQAGSGQKPTAIRLTGQRKSVETLVALLRSDKPLEASDREYLAKFIEGSLRAPRGRPRARATDFLRRPLNPVSVGANFAARYVRVWRKRYRLKNTLAGHENENRNLVDEACRLAALRVERISKGSYRVTPDQIKEMYRRPKSRRK
jgi:hypothetical protein